LKRAEDKLDKIAPSEPLKFHFWVRSPRLDAEGNCDYDPGFDPTKPESIRQFDEWEKKQPVISEEENRRRHFLWMDKREQIIAEGRDPWAEMDDRWEKKYGAKYKALFVDAEDMKL